MELVRHAERSSAGGAVMTSTIEPVPDRIDHQQLAQQLVDAARAEGVDLVGPGGLLAGLTKTVLETALEAEMSEHLGYEPHDPAGRNGQNSRNGTRSKTVLTEIGPVEIEVPHDRDASFAPVIVRKRQRRLDGVDESVLSLTARGLTPRSRRTSRRSTAPRSRRTRSPGSPTRSSRR
jgi:putative transposase